MTVTTRTRAQRGFFVANFAEDGLNTSGGLTARTDQMATFSRGGTAGAATAVDSNGRIYIVGTSTPRLTYRYNTSSGLYESHGLLLEGERTNLIVQSDACTAANGWVVSGLTATAAYATHAGISLTRLSDMTTSSYIFRIVTLTGDGIKAVSFIVASDNVPGTIIAGLRDDSAGDFRALATITVSADNTITATATVGTLLGIEYLGDGAYRLLMQSTACTAANDHSFQFNGTGGTLTALRIARCQVENASVPSSTIPTGASSVTRLADVLTFPFALRPQELTIYLKLAASALLGRGRSGFVIANQYGATPPLLGLFDNGTNDGMVYAQYSDGSVASTALTYQTPSAYSAREFCVYLSATGQVRLDEIINGAAVVSSGLVGTARALATTWSGAWLNVYADTIQQFTISAGNQSVASMRAL